MTAPFSNYLAAQALSGYGYDDDELELAAMGAYGVGPMMAARKAMRFLKNRRAERCSRFLERHPNAAQHAASTPGVPNLPMPVNMPNPAAPNLPIPGASNAITVHGYGSMYDLDGYGAYGDETDDLDDEEMAAEEAEVDQLLGEDDDDDEWGDDYDDDEDGAAGFGANLARIDRRIGKLKEKLSRLEAKLDATPQRRRRKRRRLMRAINRIKRRIMRKQGKKERKAHKVAAKLGVPAAVLLAGGAGAAAGYGLSRAAVSRTEQQIDRAAAERAMGVGGQSTRVPYMGQEIRIPFVDATTGSPVIRVTVAAGGVGLRTATISMVTQILSYASFEVLGVDTDLKVRTTDVQGVGLSDALVNVLLNSIFVNGGINLLYQTENVSFGAQTVSGQLTCARSIPGIRSNVTLDKNNTASLTATFRQEIDNIAAIEASFQAALVCRVKSDTMARRAA